MPLHIVKNDITRMKVDAIVNAANSSLLGGGGVDGAIHRAAGPQLLEECRTLHGCRTGEAKITGGYRLPARYVIHTVGPIWQGGAHGEKQLLENCYRNSLELAKGHGCETAAFPLISAGAYGYPKKEAVQVAVETISRFLQENEMTVYIVVFSPDDFQINRQLLKDVSDFVESAYEEPERKLLMSASAPSGFPALAGGAAMEEETEEICEDFEMPCMGIEEMLENMDESFSQALLRLIDERNMSDAECYKRANVDRRLFHKIKSQRGYQPSKQTVLAFAVALKLSLEETRALLEKAGFALSRSSKTDIVVEYCILQGIYNILEINQVLFKMDLQPLGY